MEKTILQVTKSGSRVSNCYCDGLLQVGYAPVFLSMFGSHNSVRSVWARLRENYGSATIGPDTISLAKDFRYLKLQSSLGKGLTHLILIEERATHQVLNATSFYFLDGFGDFYSRLDRLCSVPFRKEWKSFLWEKGLEENIIRRLTGFGVEGYEILTKEEHWSKVVLQGLEKGNIS